MTTRSAIALIALLASAAATAAAPAPERTLLAEPPRAIADFQLTDQAGKTVKLADLRGAPVLMFFGFTHCAQICPTALHQLRQLEREHRAELGKTRIVIVSVDGERDSPAAMKTWLQPISTSFIGLTGPPARVHDIAAQFSAAFYKTPGASVLSNAQPRVDGNDFVLSAQGTSADVDAVARELARILREERRKSSFGL